MRLSTPHLQPCSTKFISLHASTRALCCASCVCHTSPEERRASCSAVQGPGPTDIKLQFPLGRIRLGLYMYLLASQICPETISTHVVPTPHTLPQHTLSTRSPRYCSLAISSLIMLSPPIRSSLLHSRWVPIAALHQTSPAPFPRAVFKSIATPGTRSRDQCLVRASTSFYSRHRHPSSAGAPPPPTQPHFLASNSSLDWPFPPFLSP